MQIAIMSIFVCDFCFFVYSFTKGKNQVIRKYPGRTFRLRCQNCGAVKESHDVEEYIRLLRKPRGTSFNATVSFCLPCAKCGPKAAQTLLDYPWRKEIAVWLAKAFGIVMFIGIFCAFAMSMVDQYL